MPAQILGGSGSATLPPSLFVSPGMIHMSRCVISVRQAASCCHPLREHPGSNSSGSRGGGRASWDRVAQLGDTKLPTWTARAASTTAERIGAAGSESRAWTILSATSGWRSLTIDSESAQLAQNAQLLVLRRHRPPTLSGSDAASLATDLHRPSRWRTKHLPAS